MLWQITKILHFGGLIAGVSCATVLAFLFRKSITNEALAPAVFDISRPTLNLTWLGLGLLAVSGVVLSRVGSYFPEVGLVFGLKLILAVLIIIITAYIEFAVFRKSSGLKPKEQFLLCKKNNWLCWASMFLWYVVVFLSVYSVR